MGKAANKARVAVLQRLVGGTKEPLPTLFIGIVDASLPDPADPKPPADFSDAAVVGLRLSRGKDATRVDRRPGESVSAMQKRAMKQYPDQRLFFKLYRPEPDGTSVP